MLDTNSTRTVPLFPEITDVSSVTSEAARFFHSFFTAKTLHHPAALMGHFSQERMVYTDGVLGWTLPSWQALNDVLSAVMPTWDAAGKSYATRILGDSNSAIVFMTDTPELFGGEIRAIAAVDMKDGLVTRWVDYWDTRSMASAAYDQLAGYAAATQAEFRDQADNPGASKKIREVAHLLQRACAKNDAAAAASLFSYDAALEDMTLRSQILGRAAIERYLSRGLVMLPYGSGASLVHTVGSDQGGGYEWAGSASSGVGRGITGLELNPDGEIVSMTSVYDGRRFSGSLLRELVLLVVD